MSKFAIFRKAASLKQEEVAKRLGVTQGAVSQWESGETAPTAKTLVEISELYGCTIDDLLNVASRKEGEVFEKDKRTARAERADTGRARQDAGQDTAINFFVGIRDSWPKGIGAARYRISIRVQHGRPDSATERTVGCGGRKRKG